jgi:hypothetical protein
VDPRGGQGTGEEKNLFPLPGFKPRLFGLLIPGLLTILSYIGWTYHLERRHSAVKQVHSQGVAFYLCNDEKK